MAKNIHKQLQLLNFAKFLNHSILRFDSTMLRVVFDLSKIYTLNNNLGYNSANPSYNIQL